MSAVQVFTVSGAHTAADIDAMLDCASDVLGDMVTDGVLH
jgi:hypothetical protein